MQIIAPSHFVDAIGSTRNTTTVNTPVKLTTTVNIPVKLVPISLPIPHLSSDTAVFVSQKTVLERKSFFAASNLLHAQQ